MHQSYRRYFRMFPNDLRIIKSGVRLAFVSVDIIVAH